LSITKSCFLASNISKTANNECWNGLIQNSSYADMCRKAINHQVSPHYECVIEKGRSSKNAILSLYNSPRFRTARAPSAYYIFLRSSTSWITLSARIWHSGLRIVITSWQDDLVSLFIQKEDIKECLSLTLPGKMTIKWSQQSFPFKFGQKWLSDAKKKARSEASRQIWKF